MFDGNSLSERIAFINKQKKLREAREDNDVSLVDAADKAGDDAIVIVDKKEPVQGRKTPAEGVKKPEPVDVPSQSTDEVLKALFELKEAVAAAGDKLANVSVTINDITIGLASLGVLPEKKTTKKGKK